MESTSSETLYAVLSAEARPWVVSTFPEADPTCHTSGCTTARSFVTTAAFGHEMLPSAGPVSLTIRDSHDLTVLVALTTFRVRVQHLEIHIRLDMMGVSAFDIDALCRAIVLYGPKVQNMSLTVPHTVDLAEFRMLYKAWESVVAARSTGNGESHASLDKTVSQVSIAERTQAMASVSALFLSRWLAPKEIQCSDGDLVSLGPFKRMVNAGVTSLRCFVQRQHLLSEMIGFLTEFPPPVKPDVVMRCRMNDARALHPMLADLWPHCSSLWVVMSDSTSNDWTLASLMLCDEACQHNGSGDTTSTLSLTGIVLSRCSSLSNAAMPLLANVQRVDVSYCGQLTSEGFAHLGHCTDVAAKQTSLSDQDLRFFANAVSLDVSYCPVSSDGLATLHDVQAIQTNLPRDSLRDCDNICA